jgi:hypothetical protein
MLSRCIVSPRLAILIPLPLTLCHQGLILTHNWGAGHRGYVEACRTTFFKIDFGGRQGALFQRCNNGS